MNQNGSPMDKFIATDVDIVSKLCDLETYEYIIVGSGIGGGILAEELAKRKKKVLLIERGGPTFSTHICNTARPDFARGTDDAPEGNETVYNNIKAWVQTAGDSEPYVGGPLYCLGGRSIVWGLWIPQADDGTLDAHFPIEVAGDLKSQWFDQAFQLLTNGSQSNGVYPEGLMDSWIIKEAKKQLTESIKDYIAPGHEVTLGPIAAEFGSSRPYRFPQGAYNTAVPILNRIYARDEYLTVLMEAEVLQFGIQKLAPIPSPSIPIVNPYPGGEIPGIPNPNPGPFPNTEQDSTQNIQLPGSTMGLLGSKSSVRNSVDSLTIRTTGTKQVRRLSIGKAKVILSAGTIGTADIALRSGLRSYNPLVGKGLMDHAIWGVRFARKRRGPFLGEPVILQTLINICGTSALLTVTINANFFLAGSTYLPIHQYLTRKGKEIPIHEGWKVIRESDYDTIAILLEFGAELDDKNEVLNIPAPSPVIRIRREHTYSDEQSQKEMQQLAGKIRDSVIKDVFNAPVPEPDAPRLSLLGCGIYAHEVGTMRMGGPNNKPGVVDENLRVNGFSNLYACDLSVFPCSTPANPTRTLAALSLRLAEHLGGPHKQVEPALYQTMMSGIEGAKYEAVDYDSEDD